MPGDRRSSYTTAKREKKFHTKRAIEDTHRRQQLARSKRYEVSLPDHQFMVDLLLMAFKYWPFSSSSDEVLDSKESLPEIFDRPTRYSSSTSTVSKIVFATMMMALLIGAATGAEGAVLPTGFRDNRRNSKKQCEFTTRASFFLVQNQLRLTKLRTLLQ